MNNKEIRREEIRKNASDNLWIARSDFSSWELDFKKSNHTKDDSFGLANFSIESTTKAMEIADKYTEDKVTSKVMYKMIFRDYHKNRSIESELRIKNNKKWHNLSLIGVVANLTALSFAVQRQDMLFTFINSLGLLLSLKGLREVNEVIYSNKAESIISNHRSDSFNHEINEILSDID